MKWPKDHFLQQDCVKFAKLRFPPFFFLTHRLLHKKGWVQGILTNWATVKDLSPTWLDKNSSALQRSQFYFYFFFLRVHSSQLRGRFFFLCLETTLKLFRSLQRSFETTSHGLVTYCDLLRPKENNMPLETFRFHYSSVWSFVRPSY